MDMSVVASEGAVSRGLGGRSQALGSLAPMESNSWARGWAARLLEKPECATKQRSKLSKKGPFFSSRGSGGGGEGSSGILISVFHHCKKMRC